MIVWILLAIFIIAVLGGGYYYYTQMLPESAIGSTLTITEDGASVKENYRIMPTRERYIQTPYVESCHKNEPREYCEGYDKNDGLAFVYDLSLSTMTTPQPYTECPGGGHDCWYTEKYDNEGTLVGVTNKQGESLLDKMSDDIWSGKIDMNHPMFRDISDTFEVKDGVLVTKKTFGVGEQTVQAGVALKPKDIERGAGSLYFMILLIAMKKAGMEKPGKIVLKVRGARDRFRDIISRSRAVQNQASPEATPTIAPQSEANPKRVRANYLESEVEDLLARLRELESVSDADAERADLGAQLSVYYSELEQLYTELGD